MEIQEVTTTAKRREAVPIIQQLWTDKTAEEILEWTGETEYYLFGSVVDDSLVGVAGVMLADHLHHIDHAWLYDLVVDEAHRGNGYGTALVEFVEEWAADRGCEELALASPLAKAGVHEYYENHGYEKWGYVIEKEL